MFDVLKMFDVTDSPHNALQRSSFIILHTAVNQGAESNFSTQYI